jgi:membrane associated rhomboid family serine protease
MPAIPIKEAVPLRRVPLVTIALVAASVIVYVIASGGSLLGGPSNLTLVRWGAIPYEFAHYGQHCAYGLAGLDQQAVLCSGQAHVAGSAGPQPPTWITAFSSIFIQRDALQLIVNLAMLAVFGAAVEDELGWARFLVLYVLGGLVWIALAAAIDSGSSTPLTGNAGALAAVIGAYLVLRPHGRVVSVRLLPPSFATTEAWAWSSALGWVAFDALFGALGTFTGLGAAAGASYYVHYCCLALGALAVLRRSRCGTAGARVG